MKRRVISVILPVLMLVSLSVAALADNAIASTLRLEKTEGTVTLKNKNEKVISTTDGIKLYNGYSVTTAAKSYAYISLDSAKAVKLDASTKVEVRQSGKDLEAALSYGKLFFNVTAPMDDGGALNIRTSTTVTGIRGTSGCVSVKGDVTTVMVFDGQVTVAVTDPLSGQSRVEIVEAGELLTARGTQVGDANVGTGTNVTIKRINGGDVPGFAAVEIANDPALAGRVRESSGLDVDSMVNGAAERLKRDEAQAASDAADAAERIAEQKKDDVVDMLWKHIIETVDNAVSGGTTPPPPPPPITGDLIIEQHFGAPTGANVYTDSSNLVQTTLASNSTVRLVSYTGATLELSGAAQIPAGTTLDITSGAAARVNAGDTLTVNGTLNLNGTLTANGTVTNNSAHSIHVYGTLGIDGATGVLNNVGPGQITLHGGASGLDLSGGSVLNNDAVITVDGGNVSMATGATFNNRSGATLAVDGSFILNNNSVLDNAAGAQLTISAASSLTLWDSSGLSSGGTITNGGTLSLSNTSHANITGSLANSGDIDINGGSLHTASAIANTGTVRLVNGGIESLGDVLTGGTLRYAGGYVISAAGGIVGGNVVEDANPAAPVSFNSFTLNGNQIYATSLQAAVNSVGTRSTEFVFGNYTLLADLSIAERQDITFTVTNALNTTTFSITSAGKLTLNGTGLISGAPSSAGVIVMDGPLAELYITGGSITSTNTYPAVVINNASAFIMNGGEIQSNGGSAALVAAGCGSSAAVSLTGGHVVGRDHGIEIMSPLAQVSLTDMTVSSTNSGCAVTVGKNPVPDVAVGTLSISGGTYTAGSFGGIGVYAKGCLNVDISGATIESTVNATSSLFLGYGTNLTLEGGTVYAKGSGSYAINKDTTGSGSPGTVSLAANCTIKSTSQGYTITMQFIPTGWAEAHDSGFYKLVYTAP